MLAFQDLELVADTPLQLSEFYEIPDGEQLLYLQVHLPESEPDVIVGSEDLDFGSGTDTPVKALPIVKGGWHTLDVESLADLQAVWLRGEAGANAFLSIVARTKKAR